MGDVNGDGTVDIDDIVLVGENLGKYAPITAPSKSLSITRLTPRENASINWRDSTPAKIRASIGMAEMNQERKWQVAYTAKL